MSGGVLWVPNNPLMHSAGLRDSTEDALAYLRSETAGRVADHRLCAYLDGAPRMVDHLVRRSRLQLALLADYPDHHPNAPGARVGGRSLEPRPFNGALLGEQLDLLRPPHPSELALGRVALSVAEARLSLGNALVGRRVLVNPWYQVALLAVAAVHLRLILSRMADKTRTL